MENESRNKNRIMHRFNVTGSCNPKLHYMVDISGRLKEIRALIDNGYYFTVNRARQYGKTTTLQALAGYLDNDYIVISLDFQKLGNADFATEITFSKTFARYLLRTIRNKRKPVNGLDDRLLAQMEAVYQEEEHFTLSRLFEFLSDLCDSAEKPVVMIIDEIDSATNNQVFMDFLAQLRSDYLDRENTATFQSVILAGVVDVRNIKIKIRPESEHKVNSPWNIAADFRIDMSFSKDDIKGMLNQYEGEHHTGMDIEKMAGMLYDSTSGYPFLVSRLCQLIDEQIAGSKEFPDEKAAWTKCGYIEAEKMLLSEKNTLFDSLTGKITDYPELRDMLSAVLFDGKDIPYVATNHSVEIATMYGFVKNDDNVVRVSNRIFESVLYNHLLADEVVDSRMYDSALENKLYFTDGHHLNMQRVLEGFVRAFKEVSQGKDERFPEEEGRKYFMLYLKPIINGTGHSYVESRTRNLRRTDLVIEYLGEQFVIEMKIWNGPKYHADGEKQLISYLDSYEMKKGYMVIFNFNKNKETGIKEVWLDDHLLVEAFV